MPKTEPPERPITNADWEVMERIQLVLSTALQKYLDERLRKKQGGVDIVTMFMAIHNYHKVMLINMAAQISPTDPLGRKEFFKNARDTFVKGMDELIIGIENNLLQSAINEAEGRRVRKEEPN